MSQRLILTKSGSALYAVEYATAVSVEEIKGGTYWSHLQEGSEAWYYLIQTRREGAIVGHEAAESSAGEKEGSSGSQEHEIAEDVMELDGDEYEGDDHEAEPELGGEKTE